MILSYSSNTFRPQVFPVYVVHGDEHKGLTSIAGFNSLRDAQDFLEHTQDVNYHILTLKGFRN